MTDKLLAVIALLALGAFLGVLALRVQVPDLLIVLGICFILAAIDSYLALRGNNAERRSRR
jgi:uncharacterized membrane protein YfcA